jgi:hypothetical protein
MTDLLASLAALTAKHETGLLPCPVCGSCSLALWAAA